MLKIKSNTNEFTIIFSKKIGKKKNAQKISFSLCSVQHPFFFSPSLISSCFSVFSFFCFCFSTPPFVSFQHPLFVSFLPAFLFFSIHVCPFFQPKNIFFSPKQFSLQPKNIFLSPKRFCFSLKPFSVQPKIFFSVQNVFALAQILFFSSAPLFFFSLAPFIQDPIFSLVASHLFYLNKSLFSSNME